MLVGGFGLLEALALKLYAPTSHAPLADRGIGVPVHTDSTTVFTVCWVQIRLASCLTNPAGKMDTLTPAPIVAAEALLGAKGIASLAVNPAVAACASVIPRLLEMTLGLADGLPELLLLVGPMHRLFCE